MVIIYKLVSDLHKFVAVVVFVVVSVVISVVFVELKVEAKVMVEFIKPTCEFKEEAVSKSEWWELVAVDELMVDDRQPNIIAKHPTS